MMEKRILKAVEEAYRKGLQDAKGLNDISPFLLTSQIVAHEVANKFCQPLVSGSLPTDTEVQEWAKKEATKWEKNKAKAVAYASHLIDGALRMRSMLVGNDR